MAGLHEKSSKNSSLAAKSKNVIPSPNAILKFTHTKANNNV